MQVISSVSSSVHILTQPSTCQWMKWWIKMLCITACILMMCTACCCLFSLMTHKLVWAKLLFFNLQNMMKLYCLTRKCIDLAWGSYSSKFLFSPHIFTWYSHFFFFSLKRQLVLFFSSCHMLLGHSDSFLLFFVVSVVLVVVVDEELLERNL